MIEVHAVNKMLKTTVLTEKLKASEPILRSAKVSVSINYIPEISEINVEIPCQNRLRLSQLHKRCNRLPACWHSLQHSVSGYSFCSLMGVIYHLCKILWGFHFPFKHGGNFTVKGILVIIVI